LSFARMVSSNNKIVSSRFFEQSQFEQFTMSHFFQYYLGENKIESIEIGSDEEKKKEVGKLLESDIPDVEIETRVNPLTIFGTISLYAVSIYLLFTVTLACFPALTCLIVSVHPGSGPWSDVYFVPVVCFVVSPHCNFNLFLS
jgi:hypothetical protein